MHRSSPTLLVLFVIGARLALAAEPCPLVAGSDEKFSVRLTAPQGGDPLVAGATLRIDHPEKQVGIPGEGIALPKGTITGTPPDAVATANDLGDAVRIVIGRAGPLPVGTSLLTLHFERCEGAKPPKPEDFTCKVLDASDPSANTLREGNIGCEVGP